jgi:hypothetical protein
MATDALPMPRKSPVVSVLVSLAAVAVIAMAVLYLSDRRTARLTAEINALDRETVLRQMDREAQWLAQAIYDKRAILGMTRYEVELAKGKPFSTHRGQRQPEEMLRLGSVETWIYSRGEKNGFVLFGLNGQVTHSTDVKGLPPEGNAIRQ